MDYSAEKIASIALNTAPEIGPARFWSLIAHFGSAESALAASGQEISRALSIPPGQARKIVAALRSANAETETAEAEKQGVIILTREDKEYPPLFIDIQCPPPVLYVKGDTSALSEPSVAIVGTRNATAYGLAATRSFSEEFARMGIPVVSGLARGIDTEAHRAVLDSGGKTIAVLGNGLGHCYPPENRKLQQRITESGAVISEFPFARRPDKMNFPRRNRIISALALATVVIEADIRSGALITAKFAAEQGKDVFAVPGQIFARYSEGTNYLIKHGAAPAESAGDIASCVPGLADKKETRQGKSARGTPDEQKILSTLEEHRCGISIDGLAGRLEMNAGELSRNLLSLELKGLVRSMPGKVYALAK